MRHLIWKNTAWFYQHHWRRIFKTEVCQFKQFCPMNSCNTSSEDFETSGVSGEDKNPGKCSESEFAHFPNEPVKDQENAQPTQKKISLKQTLAYTNKVLFGPLLETSAERKRKTKISEDKTGIKPKNKNKKKSKKNKPTLFMQPLILKPENKHLLEILPGNESNNIVGFSHHKTNIEHDNECANSSDSRSARPRNKILLIKKPKKEYMRHESLIFNEIKKTQKIHVSSWNKEKEYNLSSSSEDTIVSGSEHHNGDNLSENIAPKSKSSKVTHLDDGFSSVISESVQEIKSLKSFRGNSMLSVDNKKFTGAPNVLDIEMIENFPLERIESSNALPSKNIVDTSENIVTIGMFDNGYQSLPSVSKILEATMGKNERMILERWKAKMIKELGEEGFELYRKELFDKGKLFHGCIYSELTGTSPSVGNMPSVQGLWTSISHVLPRISNISVLESRLIHPYLYYQGAVDCVAAYKGMPVLIDWKTSTKPKLTLKSMFDNPLQVVAYLGALNYDNNYQFPYQVQSAMLVVAYDSGLPAHVHIIDREKCQAYWKVWCARLVEFWRQLEANKSV